MIAFIISGIFITISLIVIYNPVSKVYNLELRAGYYDNAPKIYKDQKGRVIGIFPDLLKNIAEKEEWKIEWIEGSWTECLQRLENGEIDIMVDVAYSEERAELYDFNNVEILNNWGIVYKEKGSNIDSIDDLDGITVAVMKGSIHTVGDEGIKNLTSNWGISCDFLELDNYMKVFEAIDNASANAGVVNRLFGLFNEKEYNVERTSILFNPSRLMFAFPKNATLNPTLIPKIDDQLLKMQEKTNSYYYQLIDRYIYGHTPGVIPSWVVPTLIGAIVVSVFFVSVSYILKRMINVRTRELQDAHDELEIKVDDRTKELSEANERLKSLDQLKSMFIASMSHELRTPLTSIIGFTKMILKGWVGEINEEQDKQLTIILGSANHLLDLINDIIDISKIEAEKLDLRKQKYDLIKEIKKLIESLRVEAEKKKLNLMIDVPETQFIFTDKRRVNQILMNLIGNAIKFTDKGEVIVNVKSMNGTVKVSVSDTGMGIKKEDLNRLFKPFSRIIEPGKFKEGTGLGLHLSQKLAILLEGEILVESKFGKGSTFSLVLENKRLDDLL
jgi:signal transduction histidine kinase